MRGEPGEAAYWCDDRESGLGEDFYDAIDEAIARISDWPSSAPVFPGWTDTPTVHSTAGAEHPGRDRWLLGEHTKVVQERLGHSTIIATMNIYSHVTPTMQKASADRFAAHLRKA